MSNAKSSDLGFTIETGQRPKKVKKNHLRAWQAEARTQLLNKRYIGLICPTGSGKTMVQQVLAHHEAHKGRIVILATPQTMLKDSFRQVNMNLPGGTVMDWQVGHQLAGEKDTIATLRQILIDGPSNALPLRIVVCTHATLVRVVQEMLAASEEKFLKNVALFIDECHHCHANVNKLGSIVAQWVDKDIGPVCLATATFMRSDPFEDIIGPKHYAKFTFFTLPFERFLAEMEFLRQIHISYIWSNPVSALAELGKTKKPTIVYLPRGVTAPNSSWRRKFGDKANLLHDLNKAYGAKDSVELITGSQYEISGRVDELLPQLRKRETTPDVIWALGRGVEGFDAPFLERAVVVGPKDSLPAYIQLLGRLPRDVQGKTSVEFIVVLPCSYDDDCKDRMELAHAALKFGLMIAGYTAPVLAKSKESREAVRNFRNSQERQELVFREAIENTLFGEFINPRKAIEAAVASVCGEFEYSDDIVEDVQQALTRLTGSKISKLSAPFREALKGFSKDKLEERAVFDGKAVSLSETLSNTSFLDMQKHLEKLLTPTKINTNIVSTSKEGFTVSESKHTNDHKKLLRKFVANNPTLSSDELFELASKQGIRPLSVQKMRWYKHEFTLRKESRATKGQSAGKDQQEYSTQAELIRGLTEQGHDVPYIREFARKQYGWKLTNHNLYNVRSKFKKANNKASAAEVFYVDKKGVVSNELHQTEDGPAPKASRSYETEIEKTRKRLKILEQIAALEEQLDH